MAERKREEQSERRCRVCGCTDVQACRVAGLACVWAGPDLCSACVIQPLLDSPGGMFWLVEAAKAITASLQRREMPQVEQPKQRRKPR